MQCISNRPIRRSAARRLLHATLVHSYLMARVIGNAQEQLRGPGWNALLSTETVPIPSSDTAKNAFVGATDNGPVPFFGGGVKTFRDEASRQISVVPEPLNAVN